MVNRKVGGANRADTNSQPVLMLVFETCHRQARAWRNRRIKAPPNPQSIQEVRGSEQNSMKMKVSRILAISLGLISLSLPACNRMHAEEKSHEEHNKIVVTSPEAKDIVITQQYVCQIRSQQHINVKALKTDGYLEAIHIKEGQAVKKGEVMFQIRPTLYKAKLDAEVAEVRLAQVEFEQAKFLANKVPPVISQVEVLLYEAKLRKAEAKQKLAEAEMNLTTITAPFDGIIDRLEQQQGSLIKEGDSLTTLSDNSLMWVYFNVPEARYLEYKVGHTSTQSQKLELADSNIELVLANGSKFPESAGNTVTVEGKFNNETGNIAFRADFPNPDRLLRHGQTGNILIHHAVKNAIVIPQRATFEILDKRYVYVVGEDHVVHQRQITIQHEMDDIFVIKSGIGVKDKIILEGVRQVHQGEKVEYEFQKPEEALANQKQHAE